MSMLRYAQLAAMSTLVGVVLTSVATVTTGQTPNTPTTPKAKIKAKATEKAKEKEKEKAAAVTPLDLNKATSEELVEHLPGVGEATAKKIVAGRPYTKVDDLARAGVPERTIDGIRNLVTVSPAPVPAPAAAVVETPAKSKLARKKGETPSQPAVTAAPKIQSVAKAKAKARLAPGQKVNLNTASKEELDILPGIGPVRAQAIIEGRPFKTIEEIKKVKGIKEVEFSQIKEIITVK